MRVNLHDFSGHPFQVQLSRELAARGHDVVHNYCPQYVTGHGRLEVTADDPRSLRIEPVTAAVPLDKYSPLGRTRFEISYADAWRRRLDREHFDVVVSCNVPLFALARMRRYFAARRQPWVFWHQDVYSMGIADEARRRLNPGLADAVRRGAERVERAQVASASGVVAIGEQFVRQYERWGLRSSVGDNVHVIPNWAPLDDIVPGERDNAWSRAQGIPTGPLRLLYAGTLGRKHNPLLLLEMLDAVRAKGVDATLVVCSEGCGADDLAEAAQGRSDVRVLGYQPAEVFSDVLATADVMVTLLEPDAAQFSVPSKVLSYLSAGRPIVGLMPGGNPAAGQITEAGGFAGEPTRAGAREAATWLADVAATEDGLAKLGRRARELAELRFDIGRIGDRFEAVLGEAAGIRPRAHLVPSASGATPAAASHGSRALSALVRAAKPGVLVAGANGYGELDDEGMIA